MASVLPFPDNLSEDKHVESKLVPRLDESSNLSSSTLEEGLFNTQTLNGLFYACSAENRDAYELIGFLKQEGKFMPAEDGFTVDVTQVCNH